MNFLYRALRKIEIESDYVLIPKSQSPFVAEQRFPATFPIMFGPIERHAVRDHQWDGKYPTRGVSTSLNIEVAKTYSREHGVIVKISRAELKEFGIKEYIVNEILPANEIVKPKDEEVILVQDKDGNLPKEIIVEIIQIT